MPVGNQQYNQNGYQNINLNGNMQVEKKDLGKISIILTIMGLFCCGITSIPGIICGIVAFVKDRHNATNIAAMIMATIELIAAGLLLLGVAGNSITNGIGSEVIYQDTKEDAGTLLYNDNNIEIYYNGVDAGSISNIYTALKLKIYVNNNSKKNIEIKCDELKIDGYKIGNYTHITVDAGCKGSDTVDMYTSDLDQINVSSIKSIEGTFSIENKDKDKIIDTFNFHIE